MRAVIDRYIEAYNAGNVERMLQLMCEDVVFENFSDGTLIEKAVGIEQLREMAQQAVTLFKTRKQTLLSYREADAKAYAEIQFEGTFAVDLPNGIQAGQTINLKGKSEFHFVDGRISYLGDFG